MKLGVFGGSFDPVHLGHLWIAESAIEALQLDRLHWIPTATSPLKPEGASFSDEQRLQMVRLAVSGAERHFVDDREIRRGETSYTVDTLLELREEFPEAELHLIIGSDSLASMQSWHRPEQLLQIATLSVIQRGGDPPIDFSVIADYVSPERLNLFHSAEISMPVIEISSSEIRQRMAESRSIRFRVPRSVEAMIDAIALEGGH